MDVKVEDFIPAANLQKLSQMGFHKAAGAMLGVDELGLREAFAEIGRRAFMKRAEAHTIAEGIASYADLLGVEKTAALERLLRPAGMGMPLLGAGMMALPEMMKEGPIDWQTTLKKGLIGGAAGHVGGGIANLERTLRSNPAIAQDLEHAISRGM
jgi:hypothetical protein